MSKTSTTLSILDEDLAEGSPNVGEDYEPRTEFVMGPMPTLINEVEKNAPSAETGMLVAVDMMSEDQDNDDVQDASLTQDETAAVTKPSRANLSELKKTPVVLIVEDTTELAEVISATLERMDMKTIHETHGNKALKTIREQKPDVLLLDISLPDTSGWKVLEELRQEQEEGGEEAMGSLPITIVISAYGDPANRLVGKLQNVYSYLIKPFTTDEVETIVTQALASQTQ